MRAQIQRLHEDLKSANKQFQDSFIETLQTDIATYRVDVTEAVEVESARIRSELGYRDLDKALHAECSTILGELKGIVGTLANLPKSEKTVAKIGKDLALLQANVARVQALLLYQPSSPDKQQALLKLVRLFTPRSVVGYEKTRLGREEDGGYVMLDDFGNVVRALSFGIGDDASWDLDVAQRGIPTYQFDHSVVASPQQHTNLHFSQTRVIANPQDGPGETLQQIVASSPVEDGHLVLKMDVENSEWSILDQAEPAVLRQFSQIVCEFHGIEHAGEHEWYRRALRVAEKMSSIFAVVHVHGNNFQQFVCLGNVVIPRVLEITFANRDLYDFVESDEVFPTPLDRPNKRGVADLFLGRFQF